MADLRYSDSEVATSMPPGVTLQDFPLLDRFPHAAATYDYNRALSLPVGDFHRLVVRWKSRMAGKAAHNLEGRGYLIMRTLRDEWSTAP
jgi:hypothetical protein